MVRITGDEASILAGIEVIKVVLVAACISALTNLDNIWSMSVLRKHGEVTLYENNIGRVSDKAFSSLIRCFYTYRVRRDKLDKETWNALNANDPTRSAPLRTSRSRKAIFSVRTALLVASVLVSIADIAALFSLSTEGVSVADKPEFSVRTREANDVPIGAEMVWYNPHEGQLRYEYVLRRLGKRVEFRNGSEFKVDVPRRLDANLNEKWPFTIALADEHKYATVFTKDFTSEERANFSEDAGQVTGTTESGKLLRHYVMARRDADRKVCSGSISGISTTGVNGSATFCYTDELRNMSCANRKDGETVSFTMKCSEIRVERFGGNRIFDNDSIWWLNHFATIGQGEGSLMQMNSLRAYKRDSVSPSAMIIAAVLTEFPSQVVLVQREFFVDVSVVIVPNWLIASAAGVVGVMLVLSVWASVYAKVKDLVVLSNWQELLIANLLEPLDCLNRANKREFRCVVGGGDGHSDDRGYRLYVEPNAHVAAVSFVARQEIG